MGVPSNLANAKRLAVYFDNYINYLTTLDDRQPNIGQGQDKPPQTELYVRPFALDIDADQFIKVNGTGERWTGFGASFSAYAKDTLNVGGGEVALKIRGVTPARVVIKTGISATKSVVTAKTTKRKYVSRGGTSGSIPFGKGATTDTEVEAYDTIVAAVKASGGFNAATMRVSRIKEKA